MRFATVMKLDILNTVIIKNWVASSLLPNYDVNFKNTFKTAKSVFAHIFAKFEYFAKVNIYSKSPDHVL